MAAGGRRGSQSSLLRPGIHLKRLSRPLLQLQRRTASLGFTEIAYQGHRTSNHNEQDDLEEMPIKFHRTQVFRDQAGQGQTLHLDENCHNLLRSLDRTVCDSNHGRSQPDSPFAEINEWYSDGQYWSDSYNTRWNVAVTLYYLATHPDAWDFGRLLASSLDYRENWSEWSDEKRNAVADAVFVLWQSRLSNPPRPPTGGATAVAWGDTFAGRLFEFARLMELIDDRFLGELFHPEPTSNRFIYECLFVEEYWERIRNPGDPWMEHLPTQKEIRKHLQWGFFKFPEHEELASRAEQYIAWKTTYCELLDE